MKRLIKAAAEPMLFEEAPAIELVGRDSPGRAVGTDSRVLFGALAEVFTALEFDGLGDEVFRDLVIARVVEPTFKQFQACHGLAEMVVVADAGMLSTGNLRELDEADLRTSCSARTCRPRSSAPPWASSPPSTGEWAAWTATLAGSWPRPSASGPSSSSCSSSPPSPPCAFSAWCPPGVPVGCAAPWTGGGRLPLAVPGVPDVLRVRRFGRRLDVAHRPGAAGRTVLLVGPPLAVQCLCDS